MSYELRITSTTGAAAVGVSMNSATAVLTRNGLYKEGTSSTSVFPAAPDFSRMICHYCQQ
ncbi:hypothetical protein [Enterobacter cancerogenus]